jgi:ethanolamine utilization protein EutN
LHIAKVIGNAGGSDKTAPARSRKLLIIQPLNDQKRPEGRPVVALDTIGAGIGEHVFYVRDQEKVPGDFRENISVDAGIVGIIDYFDVREGWAGS